MTSLTVCFTDLIDLVAIDKVSTVRQRNNVKEETLYEMNGLLNERETVEKRK